MSKIMTQV